MGQQGVAGEGDAHLVGAHAAAERGRRARGQAADVDGHRLRGNPLADGLVIVLEEVVEDAAGGTALGADVHQADQF